MMAQVEPYVWPPYPIATNHLGLPEWQPRSMSHHLQWRRLTPWSDRKVDLLFEGPPLLSSWQPSPLLL